jgi:hypothetical protein
MDGWMNAISGPWAVAGAVLLGLVLWIAARRAERERVHRLKGRLDTTLLGRLDQDLPAPVAIIARAGETRTARQSADALVLTVTPGVKALAVVIGAILVWLVWMPGAQMTSWSDAQDMADPALRGFVPPGPWPALITAFVALSILHQFTFEARVDRDRLVTQTLLFWRREFRWRDFVGIADAGGYEYRLDFGTSRMRLPKYLVGMPGLLSFMGEVMARNRLSNARTARS